MKDRLLDVLRAALETGLDPVDALREYLLEKDSRITRREAARLAARLLANVENPMPCSVRDAAPPAPGGA